MKSLAEDLKQKYSKDYFSVPLPFKEFQIMVDKLDLIEAPSINGFSSNAL